MRWVQWWHQAPTHEAIEWTVRRALFGEPRLRDFEAPRIRITASDSGEVTLLGAVSTSDMRNLAERVARNVASVVMLRNDLRTDADVTRDLRSRLDSDPRTRGLAKESVVFQGTAELRGSATYDAQLAARKMAEAIDGVRGVTNYMQVATSSQTVGERRAV
jgi:osmotically-inducible protein OsmY